MESFTFVTYPLNYLLPTYRVRFSTLPQFPAVRNQIWGVDENYLDVAYSQYYHATDINTGTMEMEDVPRTRDGKIDVVKLMVINAGGAVLPEEASGGGGRGRVRVPADLAAAPADIAIGKPVNETRSVRKRTKTNSIGTSFRGFLCSSLWFRLLCSPTLLLLLVQCC